MEATVRKESQRLDANTIIDDLTKISPALRREIRASARLEKEQASYDPALKETRDVIIAAALADHDLDEEGSVTFIVDGLVCRVSSGYTYRIPAESERALKELLGNRYDELVETVVELRPTQRMIELACDGDLSPEIRKHLSIRLQAPSVSILQDDTEHRGVAGR